MSAIKHIDKEYERLTKQKDTLTRAVDVINIWKNNYDAIKNAIVDESSKYQSANVLDGRLMKDKQDEIAEELSKRLNSALNNLIDSISRIKDRKF